MKRFFLFAVMTIGAATAMSCSGSSSPAEAAMPTGSDLPGKGWVKVGNNSFDQFDLPEDTSAAPEACQPALTAAHSLETISDRRDSRANRMFRSSKNSDSVQVTVYAQEYSDSATRDEYFATAPELEWSDATTDCFIAANSGDGVKVRVAEADTRVVFTGGSSFAREVVYTTPQGGLQQRFEGYWWVEGDLVIQVQFVGPKDSITPSLVRAVIDAVEEKVDEAHS